MAFLGAGSLAGKKTHVTAALGAITAVAGYLTGNIDLVTLVQALFNAAGLSFLRSGVSKLGQ